MSGVTRRCEELEPLHSAWIDSELGAVDRVRMASHLQRCSRCRNAVHGLRATQSVLRSLPVRTLPSGIAVSRAGGDAPRRRRASAASLRRVATRSSVVAAALVVVLGAAGFVAGSSQPSQPPVSVPVDVYVADHLVRSVGGPVSTPVLVEPDR